MVYRDASLIRNCLLLGPYSRTIPRGVGVEGTRCTRMSGGASAASPASLPSALPAAREELRLTLRI